MTWARRCLCFVFGLVLGACDSQRSATPAHEAGRVADAAALDSGAVGDAGHEPSASGSYAAVSEIFRRSCAYTRCHAGVPTGAALSLADGVDYAAALVNVPSCEYPPMPRVTPGDLERSWLWIKLNADVRPRSDPLADYIVFEPDPGWDPSDRPCRDEAPDGAPLFGQRMPLTAPNMLPPRELAAIRDWILEGAPH